MKIVIHENEALPFAANPRFWDRLLAVCSVLMLGCLASAVWLKVQDAGPGAYSGQPIRIEIRTPIVEGAPALSEAPPGPEVAAAVR
jgi:hypothetical protein